jgi:hypothetical protein
MNFKKERAIMNNNNFNINEISFKSKECKNKNHSLCKYQWEGFGFHIFCNCECHRKQMLGTDVLCYTSFNENNVIPKETIGECNK